MGKEDRLSFEEERSIREWFRKEFKGIAIELCYFFSFPKHHLEIICSPSRIEDISFDYTDSIRGKPLFRDIPRDQWTEEIKKDISTFIERNRDKINEIKELMEKFFFGFLVRKDYEVSYSFFTGGEEDIKEIIDLNKEIDKKFREIFGERGVHKMSFFPFPSDRLTQDLKNQRFFKDSPFIYVPYRLESYRFPEVYKKIKDLNGLEEFIEEGIKEIKRRYKEICDYYDGIK